MNVEKDTVVANDIVRHIVDVVNGAIVAYVARHYAAVRDAYRHTQVVILKCSVLDGSYPHQAKETVVLHKVGVELVCDHDVVPTRGGVAVLDKALHLIGTEMPPNLRRRLRLFVPIIIFISPIEILLIDEVLEYPVVLYYCYFIHNLGVISLSVHIH